MCLATTPNKMRAHRACDFVRRQRSRVSSYRRRLSSLSRTCEFMDGHGASYSAEDDPRYDPCQHVRISIALGLGSPLPNCKEGLTKFGR